MLDQTLAALERASELVRQLREPLETAHSDQPATSDVNPPRLTVPGRDQVAAAVRQVFPPDVAAEILADDAIGALTYRLMLRCQDTGQSPAGALRDMPIDDRAVCASAEHPAAFLANRCTGGAQ
ncbi:MAG: hypothetical protein ACREQ5_12285, partial [Candidatus Dormibacteria bacterium]